MSPAPDLSAWPDAVVALVRQAGVLCLDVEKPGWDDARGYLFDEEALTLYFPVAKKYLPADPADFQVLIWSEPRVLITGELVPARSDDDTTIQLALAEAGEMPTEDARYMLLDQRSGKARTTSCKLCVTEVPRVQS